MFALQLSQRMTEVASTGIQLYENGKISMVQIEQKLRISLSISTFSAFPIDSQRKLLYTNVNSIIIVDNTGGTVVPVWFRH